MTAEALRRQSSVLRTQCRWDEAIDAARRSVDIAVTLKRNDLYAEALNAEAAVHQSRGQFDTAVKLLRRILEICDDDHRIRGIALQNLGSIAAQRGELDDAQSLFSESSAAFHKVGYDWGEAAALNNAGRAALDAGNPRGAITLLEQACVAAQRVADADLVALARINQAAALGAVGEYGEAERLASVALGYFSSAGDRWREIECLRVLGDLMSAQGSVDPARRCHERALNLAREIGATADAALQEARLRHLPAPGTSASPGAV
ncbi:MAG TPA: tetratricopeptide repeat protein [Gemmatimonadaceae bacterium]|nr:tetratricopeptide repeat protein [Gemmatimonadaceae bacterium]